MSFKYECDICGHSLDDDQFILFADDGTGLCRGCYNPKMQTKDRQLEILEIRIAKIEDRLYGPVQT